jgi:hypothetical protein
MRKEAGFRIEDSISTWYKVSESLQPVFRAWGGYIRQETLSKQLLSRTPPKDAYAQSHEIDGESVSLGVRRIKAR